VKVLVTGADGFVGSWLIPRLLQDGHEVTAAVGRGTEPRFREAVPLVELELRDAASVSALTTDSVDAVVHLAGLASGADARQDPGVAWEVNAAGTARLCESLAAQRESDRCDPVVLLASTAEVYGQGVGVPRVETDPVAPCSPYAASKLGAEVAALEVYRRTGLRVVIARAFPHTGRGQDRRFVVPAFAGRLLEAKATGRTEVEVGNLDPVRDILHVADVVDAYCGLLTGGVPGEAYNVASGRAVSIGELFEMLATAVQVRATPVVASRFARAADVPHLVGNSEKLHKATGWRPQLTLERALEEVVGAQAD
jgi:GDP-4-dehydro-6-deoxy-D-mannose reductase